MKVAFATTDGINVDEHFGRSESFAIYELKEDSYEFREMRNFQSCEDKKHVEGDEVHEQRATERVDALADCKLVYLTEIGGPMAARLGKRGIMPVKVKEIISIEEAINKLYENLKTTPSLWLKRLINSEDTK